MKESEFWALLKRGFSTDPAIHACRVENESGSGMSDVNACRNGVERWIELKVVHGNWVHFRNSQRSWIVKRTAAGGVVWILVRDGDAIFICPGSAVMRDEACIEHVDDKSFKIHKDGILRTRSWFKLFPWQDIISTVFGHWGVT